MEKPISLITGATEGVGKATATELARKGFTVILAARNAAKAEMVIKEIAASTGNSNLDYIIGDLASLTQIRQLSETFKQRYPRLDVLINNAGIYAASRVMTEDGYESTFQVNYLSQFHLTHLLLDELKKSHQGRIINLSSTVYRVAKFDEHNLQGERRFSPFSAYSASKLLMLLYTIELANRLKGTRVTANAVHPGVVRTQMMFDAPGAFRAVTYASLPFSISLEKGAATSVYLASSPEVQNVSGKYFTSSKMRDVKSRFNSQHNRNILWDLSMKSLTAGIAR